MTTPRTNWQSMAGKSAPELVKHVNDMQAMMLADGALTAKTKTLMMMLCDAMLAHSDGVAALANRARSLGATEAEIAETLSMAFLMGGMPALVTGANAFRDKA